MVATAEQRDGWTRPAAPVAKPGFGARLRGALAKGRLPVPVLLYLIAVVLPVYFQVGPVNLGGIRLLLLVLVVPLSLRLLSGAYGRVLPVDILMFLHVLWFTAALAINSPDQVIANAGSTGIEFIGGYALGRACIRDRESFVALARALGTICLLLMGFVLFEAVTGRSLIPDLLDRLPGITSTRDVDIGRRLGLYRVQSVFVHPIHSGLFFTVIFSLTFLGLRGVYSTARRWLVSAACVLCAFLALSSGALLALLLQFGLIAWARLFRNFRARWWLLVGLFALAYVAIDLASNRTPLHVFMSYATFSSGSAYWRMLIFDYGMDNVWANPWFGIGLNDWVRPRWMGTSSVDNFWLLTAMRYGIPGFLFLAGGYLWALWKVGTRRFDTDPALWNLRRAWMFSFVGLTFTLTTVHIWSTVFSFTFFLFGAGMWFLYAQPKTAAAAEPLPEAEPRLRYTRFPAGAAGRGLSSAPTAAPPPRGGSAAPGWRRAPDAAAPAHSRTRPG